MGHVWRNIKNIARPVRAFSVALGVRASGRDPRIKGEGSAPVRMGAAAAPALPLPDKPSLAVLPFQNMSGDPEQEYFVDGMVEEIITALSRIRWLFVPATSIPTS